MSDGQGVCQISIIIPARNEAARIVQTVQAVLNAAEGLPHGAGGVEVLVVDNASTDETINRLRPMTMSGIVRAIRCDRLGAARARNDGASAARGEILVFVDADTLVCADALQRVVRWVGDGFAAGICRYGSLSPGLRAWVWWTFWNHVRRLPLANAKAMPAFMFCTREVFNTYGPFDEGVAIAEEWPILAGLYRADRARFMYDRGMIAKTSSRRMELQRFGYSRTYLKYLMAILFASARINYTDRLRERDDPIAG